MPLAALLAVFAALAPHVQDPAPAPDPPCRVIGTFVDEAGLPVPGVTLRVKGWRGSAERVERFGLPQGWQNPAAVTTGDDGKFSLSFVPPRAFGFSLSAHVTGFEGSGWMLDELEPGQDFDFGTVTLEREAVLVGHLLDAEGNLLIERWIVTAMPRDRLGAGALTPMLARSSIDPATGQFRITGLGPGNLNVRASDGKLHTEDFVATTVLGTETFLELRYSGPEARRRLVVAIGSWPFHAFRPGPGTVHAIAEDGTRHALTPARGRANDWQLVDVQPGTYRVEIRDPRFAEWMQDDVRTGQPTSARLVGSAALRVAVVDGATGASVEDYSLDVDFRNVDMSPAEYRVRERSVAPPAGGVYDGIVPGDLTLSVKAHGWPKAHVDVDALSPGETRDVTVTLSSGMTLEGRVVDTAGRPLAGVAVQVTRAEYPGHDRASGGTTSVSATANGRQFALQVGYRDDATTTDEDGSFRFRGLSAGTHAVLAQRGRWNEVWTTVELPRAEPLALTLPDAASASIRLLLPAGTSPAGLRFGRVTQAGAPFDPSRSARTSLRDDPWMCGADGSFPARHLPLGTSQLDLMCNADGGLGGFGASHERLMQLDVTIAGTNITEVELDLRESLPVFVTLLTPLPAVAPETPEAPWMIHAQLVGDWRPHSRSSSSMLAPNGQRRAHTEWTPPGIYRAQVTAPGVRWQQGESIEVVRGAPNVFDLAVPLAGRELRVLRPDGAPLANTPIVYWTDPEQREVGTTNAQGGLVVVLLEGTLSLATLPPPDPAQGPPRRTRATGIDARVLAGLAARASAAFGPGEGPLELRLQPE